MKDLSHLATVKQKATKKYHGAYYRDHPTPSGEHRLLLQCTTDGFDCEKTAARAINEAFPNMKPVDVDKCEEWAEPDPLPRGVEIVHVEPHDKDKSYVQAWNGEDIELTERQLEVLVGRGILVLDSCSGRHPNLSATYTSYMVDYNKQEYEKLSAEDKLRYDKWVPWIKTFIGNTDESFFEENEAGRVLVGKPAILRDNNFLCLPPLIIQSGPPSIEEEIEKIVGCAVGNAER